jgi:acetylornithine deacetylase
LPAASAADNDAFELMPGAQTQDAAPLPMTDHRRMHSLPTLPQMFHELVALPSVSSENRAHDMGNLAVIERLANWLQPLGFACEILPLPGNPSKANLIATLGSGPGGLVLSGHADTVPWDDSGWDSDPFTLDEREGRYHGLGICDMKGFLAMAVQVAAEFAEQPLREPLILLATADEESGMDGVKALVASGRPKARHAVIGEPTNLAPIRLHKGILMETLHVHGHAGHSSRPDLGANAIEGIHQVIAALVAHREALKTRPGNPAFRIPHPTLNLGHVHGGDSANRIPAHCRLDVDLRFGPEDEIAALRAELRAVAASGLTLHGCRLDTEVLFEGIPAFSTEATTDIVRACESLTGHSAGAVEFATEGPFLSRLGMDTVILGPGDIAVAHQPNEYLDLDRINPMLKILRGLVRRFCL